MAHQVTTGTHFYFHEECHINPRNNRGVDDGGAATVVRGFS